MNTTFTITDLPFSQVDNLLTDEENYRQSVVFLPSHYAHGIEAGDFILVRSDRRETQGIGEYATGGLLLVTNVLDGVPGVAGGMIAASTRPLPDDQHEDCDECGGKGYQEEHHGPEEGGGGTEYLGCEKCHGYGKVAVL